MFWLDGHWSGDGTAQGFCNTPIMKELKAIKDNGITDAVILVDDICCFHPDMDEIAEIALGYPTVHRLKEELLSINPNYQIIIYGDIAIAWPSHYHIEVSPLIQALTISRFYDDQLIDEALFQAEASIATETTAPELEALWDMCTWHFGWHRAYPYFWYSLSLFSQKRYGEAADNFGHVLDAGYQHWRVYWYKALAEQRAGRNPSKTLEIMRTKQPEVSVALEFMDSI